MLIRTDRDGFQHPHASEITPRGVYEDRRQLLKWMATGVAGAALATWAQREALAQQVQRPGKLAQLSVARSAVPGAVTMEKVTDYKDAVLAGDRRQIPGAVRASASIATTTDELDVFLAAVADIARHPDPPVAYDQDRSTGDYWPRTDATGWTATERHHTAPCGRG